MHDTTPTYTYMTNITYIRWVHNNAGLVLKLQLIVENLSFILNELWKQFICGNFEIFKHDILFCVSYKIKFNIGFEASFLLAFHIPFFWWELWAPKCCACFKELSLFIKRRQGILGSTKIYIDTQDISNINIFFSLCKVFYEEMLPIHSYLVCVIAKDARFRNVLHRQKHCYHPTTQARELTVLKS